MKLSVNPSTLTIKPFQMEGFFCALDIVTIFCYNNGTEPQEPADSTPTQIFPD